MNISPSTLLLVIIVSIVANVLYVMVSRSRNNRQRHVVEINGIMSSSYVDLGPEDGWLPTKEPVAPSEGWAAQPMEYPAPTPLEQRSVLHDEEAPGAVAEGDVDVEGHGEGELAQVDREDLDYDGNDQEGEVERVDPVIDEAVASVEAPTGPDIASAPAGPPGSLGRGRDPLTGLLDALSFEDALAREDAREQRYRHSATVIVFELDGLAKLVDRLGTDPGDRIEAALSDTISRLARQADYVARLERGRYAVLLPETDEVAAINYVERIRRACDLWLESGAIAMRLAIGWASTGGDATLDGALRTATDRMRLELRRHARAAADATEMPLHEEAAGF